MTHDNLKTRLLAEDEVEIWLPMVGGEGRYEVSNMGRIKSLARPKCRERILRPAVKSGGYETVCIYFDGVRRPSTLVHRLVLTAFVGPSPDGCVACHNNGNSRDNRLSNLRWGTPEENVEDTRKHGTLLRSSMKQRKITDPAEIAFIRSRPMNQKELAAHFDVSKTVIQRVQYRKYVGDTARTLLNPQSEPN